MVLVIELIAIINKNIINKPVVAMELNRVMYLLFMVVIMGTDKLIVNLIDLHMDLYFMLMYIIDIMNLSYPIDQKMHMDYKLLIIHIMNKQQ